MSKTKQATEELLCVGCVAGCDTECGSYAPDTYQGCSAWVPGTRMFPGGLLALGFPKGFNRIPVGSSGRMVHVHWMAIKDQSGLKTDWLNVPIWHLREGSWTFIKIATPRLGLVHTYVTDKTPDELRELGYELGLDISDRLEEMD